MEKKIILYKELQSACTEKNMLNHRHGIAFSVQAASINVPFCRTVNDMHCFSYSLISGSMLATQFKLIQKI